LDRQQFNYLLEQRDQVAGELSRLASIRRDSSTRETDVRALIDFINESDCIPRELETHFIQLLDQRLGEPA
jgi:hypothetical protein